MFWQWPVLPIQALTTARGVRKPVAMFSPADDHAKPTAEIRLAKAIAGGRKLSEVARLLGVSSETARAHLKSVFAKSGAHSQSELSVLLDRMAGPQDEG